MSRFTPILEALGKEGWSLKPLELASDCWWAKDIWELRSRWTPRDATIHLSMLVDPMEEIDFNNVPEAAVWAVGISAGVPHDRLEAEQILVPINRRMQEAAAEIIAETIKLRMARQGSKLSSDHLRPEGEADQFLTCFVLSTRNPATVSRQPTGPRV